MSGIAGRTLAALVATDAPALLAVGHVDNNSWQAAQQAMAGS